MVLMCFYGIWDFIRIKNAFTKIILDEFEDVVTLSWLVVTSVQSWFCTIHRSCCVQSTYICWFITVYGQKWIFCQLCMRFPFDSGRLEAVTTSHDKVTTSRSKSGCRVTTTKGNSHDSIGDSFWTITDRLAAEIQLVSYFFKKWPMSWPYDHFNPILGGFADPMEIFW